MSKAASETRTRSHINLQGQSPAGAVVQQRSAELPYRVILGGRFVTLRPLDARAHAEPLYEVTKGPGGDRLWFYLPYGPFADVSVFAEDIQQKARSIDPMFFAIVDNATGRAMGHAAYTRAKPQNCSIEVGHALFAPALQRTAGATEAMYLMAKHAFEDLGYRRYEWKCDTHNAASRQAALRLGFTFEGISRQHMIVKDRNRDTAWFSIIDSEWPALRKSFEAWLEPSNFDRNGKQKNPLRMFRVKVRLA